MSQERKMTIKRGMTRLKTIKAQIENITEKIRDYGAINNKKMHPYGDMKVDLNKNHAQAKAEIESLFQQYNDLIQEYLKIKRAIARTNLSTMITVAGKTMTLVDAITYRDAVADFMTSMIQANNKAVAAAKYDVERYNTQFANIDENVRPQVIADVLYLVNQDQIKELDKFLIEFLTELDGELDSINAVTELVFDEE
jgi:hypothetical protein